jgi:hypothetical protein
MRQSHSVLVWFAPWITPWLAFCLTACEVQPRNGAPSPEDPALAMVQTADWKDIVFTSLRSEITLQETGHFYVEPNACYRKESGVLSLELWNRLARAINQVWLAARVESESCVPAPLDAPQVINGIKIRFWNAPEQLLISSISSGRSGRICSTVSDPEALREMSALLGQLVQIARAEGC